MKIIINATQLISSKTRTGLYAYILNLLNQFIEFGELEKITLAHHIAFSIDYSMVPKHHKIKIRPTGFHIKPLQISSHARLDDWLLLPYQTVIHTINWIAQKSFFREKRLEGALYHNPSAGWISENYSNHRKNVATIHDIIPICFPRGFRPSTVDFFRKQIDTTLNQVDQIIVDSNCTKIDLLNTFKANPEKIHVVYPGVSPIFKPQTLNDQAAFHCLPRSRNQQYLLGIASSELRKNLSETLKCFSRLKQLKEFRKHYLILYGRNNSTISRLINTHLSNAYKSDVVVTGYLPTDQLPLLFSNASLFLFPSLYEGFGLPVLEAMACGTPVVTSNNSSIPEIAEDATLLIDPTNENEILDAVKSILQNDKLKKGLREKGIKQASRFSWKRCADETLSIYQKAIRA